MNKNQKMIVDIEGLSGITMMSIVRRAMCGFTKPSVVVVAQPLGGKQRLYWDWGVKEFGRSLDFIVVHPDGVEFHHAVNGVASVCVIEREALDVWADGGRLSPEVCRRLNERSIGYPLPE